MLKKIAVQLAKITSGLLVVSLLTILVASKFENPFGIRSFVVLTGSMEPAIKKGSVILTRKSNTYIEGDVVAFRKNDVTVTHRIVEAQNSSDQSTFITKGDANNSADTGSITQSNILGRNIVALPFIGTIILFMRSLGGFILLVILPASLYIGYEMYSIKSELRRIALKQAQI